MSNAWGFQVIKIYWLETSVYYNHVFTKQMQYKKLNQMRFVNTNTGNRSRMYEMAQSNLKWHVIKRTLLTQRNFLVFIIYSYTIPIDSFPLLWRESHQSHCCLYTCLCNQLHVFMRWSCFSWDLKNLSFCLV